MQTSSGAAAVGTNWFANECSTWLWPVPMCFGHGQRVPLGIERSWTRSITSGVRHTCGPAPRYVLHSRSLFFQGLYCFYNGSVSVRHWWLTMSG